jgi:hypothetical protein
MSPQSNSFYSNWIRMQEQAKRYFTFSDKMAKLKSYFTPRTFLSGDEVDKTKARPSVVTQLEPNFYQVLGGKLVSCLDIAEELDKRI